VEKEVVWLFVAQAAWISFFWAVGMIAVLVWAHNQRR
jgi:hypothetical protein